MRDACLIDGVRYVSSCDLLNMEDSILRWALEKDASTLCVQSDVSTTASYEWS